MMHDAKALTGKTKRFAAAKLDWWEAQYFFAGSKQRTRKTAKRELNRAVRRAERAVIDEIIEDENIALADSFRGSAPLFEEMELYRDWDDEDDIFSWFELVCPFQLSEMFRLP